MASLRDVEPRLYAITTSTPSRYPICLAKQHPAKSKAASQNLEEASKKEGERTERPREGSFANENRVENDA
jgi:hypothetical protein